MLQDGSLPLRIGRPNSRSYNEFRDLLRSDPCSYCGRRPPWCRRIATHSTRMTADHIVARSQGGADSWKNLTAACGRCNGEKGRRDLLSFLLSRL